MNGAQIILLALFMLYVSVAVYRVWRDHPLTDFYHPGKVFHRGDQGYVLAATKYLAPIIFVFLLIIVAVAANLIHAFQF